MEARTRRKRRSPFQDGDDQEELPAMALERHNHEALEDRRGVEDIPMVQRENMNEEDDFDRNVDRFFEIMSRIRDMNRSWGRRANQTRRISTAMPPPWTPKFHWEDFAPAGAAQRCVQGTIAVSITVDQEAQRQGTVFDDGAHGGGSAITTDDHRQVIGAGGVNVAGGVFAAHGNKGYDMTNAKAFDFDRRGTGELLGIRPPDSYSYSGASAGSGPSAVGSESSCGTVNL